MSKQITIEETLAIAADISTSVPERIAEEVITKATKDSVQNIGGFPITDLFLVQDRLDQAKANRAQAIDIFKHDSNQLKEKLTSFGIDKYLAIIPTTYWKNLCDRHNLETVNPDINGRCQINTKIPYELVEAAKHRWNQAAAIVAGLALLSCAATVNAFLSSPVFWHPYSAAISAAVTVGLGFACWALSYIGVMRGKVSIQKYIKETPYAKLMRDMFMSSHDYRLSQAGYAQLILPAPPVDVVSLLRKLRDHSRQFTVTADPRALQFTPSIEELYLKGHAVERERIRLDNLDPIITIAYNNATAVLAQFGDFKWELDVIEDIMSSIPLPTSRNY